MNIETIVEETTEEINNTNVPIKHNDIKARLQAKLAKRKAEATGVKKKN
jgi:hypothetical protein